MNENARLSGQAGKYRFFASPGRFPKTPKGPTYGEVIADAANAEGVIVELPVPTDIWGTLQEVRAAYQKAREIRKESGEKTQVVIWFLGSWWHMPRIMRLAGMLREPDITFRGESVASVMSGADLRSSRRRETVALIWDSVRARLGI